MMQGDYQKNLARFRNVSTTYAFAAATDYSAGQGQEKIAAKAKHEIVIQRILLSVTTDNAATQLFQADDGVTQTPIAMSKASPGLGPIEWNFGDEGYVLPVGTALKHKMSGAGMAGTVTIQAYLRPQPDQSSFVPADA